MGTASQEPMSRGLLTDAEREFLRGERDVEDPDGYLRNLRYRFRQRMDRLEEDINVLRAAEQDDLVDEFLNQFGRVERLEREVDELRRELEQERGD